MTPQLNYNGFMAGRLSDYERFRKAYKGTGAAQLYTDWNDRAVYTLKTLISDDKQFVKDIEDARRDTALSDDEKTLSIIKQYGLRYSMTELLRNYIINNEINPFYMRPPVIAVSTKENIAGVSVAHNDGKSLKEMTDAAMIRHPNEWVYLIIDPECSQTDMEAWVSTYWKVFMQDRLDAIKPSKFKRVTTSRFIKRDRTIHEHIKVRKLPVKDIAEVYGITPEYARRIAIRVQNKTNKP